MKMLYCDFYKMHVSDPAYTEPILVNPKVQNPKMELVGEFQKEEDKSQTSFNLLHSTYSHPLVDINVLFTSKPSTISNGGGASVTNFKSTKSRKKSNILSSTNRPWWIFYLSLIWFYMEMLK